MQNVAYVVGGGLTMSTAFRSDFPGGLSLAELCVESIQSLRVAEKTGLHERSKRLINSLLILLEKRGSFNLEELIEHLMTSGNPELEELSRQLSNEFSNCLGKRVAKLIDHLDENDTPTQDSAEMILALHQEDSSDEHIVGFITTNYDTLLERALKKRNLEPDFGFDHGQADANNLPLLKLHGSIDWRSGVPVKRLEAAYVNDAEPPLWIGPRRVKQARDYPFNGIWAKARELLARADVIRVIGASLYASDWHICQLLFLTARLDSLGEKKIELINRTRGCDRLVEAYPLLPLVPVYEDDEVIRYFCSLPKEAKIEEEHREQIRGRFGGSSNPVDLWLQAKVFSLSSVENDDLLSILG